MEGRKLDWETYNGYFSPIISGRCIWKGYLTICVVRYTMMEKFTVVIYILRKGFDNELYVSMFIYSKMETFFFNNNNNNNSNDNDNKINNNSNNNS